MTDLDTDLTAAEVAADAEPLLRRISKRREKRSDTKKFDIPLWEGDLKLEFEILDTQDIQAMIRRARAQSQGNGSANSDADASFLIKACVGVWAYDDQKDEGVKVADSLDKEWSKLVGMLDPHYPEDHVRAGDPVEIANAKELVVYLFAWKNLVLASFGQRVARWMQNPSTFEDPQ
jgi:hypothetical protein